MKNKITQSLIVTACVGIFAVGLTLAASGCAHAHDGSKTRHVIAAYGETTPPGWTTIKPDITNTPAENMVSDYEVIAPSGTNAAGFWTSLVQRPHRFLAYREEWVDTSAGGGTFVFTDPEASQLVFTRTNQTALGGSRAVAVGSIKSTVTSNDVAAITATGTAGGSIIGAAVSAATGSGAAVSTAASAASAVTNAVTK
jgi:hypothetical protein